MALYKFDFMFYVMLCYGDEIWCSMAFCAQVAGIGVGGGCDCILVRKITVRQPDHSRIIIDVDPRYLCKRHPS